MNDSNIDLTELHSEWSTTDESSEGERTSFGNSELDAWSSVGEQHEPESGETNQQVEQVLTEPIPSICAAYTKWNRRCCLGVEKGSEFCKRHTKMSFNTCDICYGNMYCEVKLSCDHSFCRNCIYKWSNKGDSCPLCRKLMFYVNHSRDVIIKKAANLIMKADHLLQHKFGFDEKTMTDVLEYLLENEWLKSFDPQYKSILESYVDYSIEKLEGENKKLRKFNNFRKIIRCII